MDVKVTKGRIEEEAAEAVVLGVYEGEKSLPEETAAVDRFLKGQIRELIGSGEFKGKLNQVLIHHGRGEIRAIRIILVGLGPKKRIRLETIRQAMGSAARRARESGAGSFSTPLHGQGLNKISAADSAQAIVEGSLLGLYQFNVYRTENREELREVRRITLVDRTGGNQAAVAAAARRGAILAEATNDTRDLCNHPANVVTPSRLAAEARKMARKFNITVRVIEEDEAESLGMGAFLCVARGSLEPPKFIILEYHGAKKKKPPVVIVGKSVTFDSGGISIKPAEKMDQMKTDMSGGAAVLGTLKAVAQLKLPINIIGILPAVENMPSGRAVKPGDIVRAMSGKTIEVINTDAEGRMILADALTYAGRYKPSAIVDLATLTGACVVALGNHATGLMGTGPKLIAGLKQAGEHTGERVWELPLWEEYQAQIKSDVADIKNVGGRGAGSITAAAFLQKFVGDYPWAHLDIAGTSWTDEARPYTPKGGTGVGVRLLVRWLSGMR